MYRFHVGQRWVSADGSLHAEVTTTRDEARAGDVVITGAAGDVVDRFSGLAAAFLAAGRWRPVAAPEG